MKNIVLTLTAILLTTACGYAQIATSSQEPPELSAKTKALLSYQDEITIDFLRSHLKVFAADSMKGRETGTPALKKAARYLAAEYREMGLKPAGVNNTYFQPFNLFADVTDSVSFVTYLDSERVSRSVSSKTSTANYVRGFWGSDTLKAPVVFAGFAVVDSLNNVNHLSGLDLKDKWVMFFEKIPHVVNGDTLISHAINQRSRLITLLREKGVTKFLVISGEQTFSNAAKGAASQFGEKTQMRLAYLEDSSDNGSSRSYNYVSREMAARLLGLNSAEELKDFKKELTEDITGFKPYATGYSLKQVPHSQKISFESQNVAALLKGSDPELKDQVVVLTSHYDHVGIGRPDSTGDAIYNGADDDGSGTISLLNVAHAFAQARENGVRPRRSILFLNVSGEEKGLLGSRYYSDHPLFPIEKTAANLNVDMIGRIDSRHEKKGITDYVYVIGGKLISSGLDSLLQVANKKTGELILSERFNDLNDPNQFYRRSDHWNFGRLGVPFIFFFTGVHEDYHRPSDEVQKIRFEKMAEIARTIYGTTVLVANTDERPVVDNQAFIEKTQE